MSIHNAYIPGYLDNIAELSREETMIVEHLTLKYGMHMEVVMLRSLIQRELPLCHPDDVNDCIMQVKTAAQKFNSNPGNIQTRQHPSPSQTVPNTPQVQTMKTPESLPMRPTPLQMPISMQMMPKHSSIQVFPKKHTPDKDDDDYSMDDPKRSNKRWSDDETRRLFEYISKVDGRISWPACARYVGNKASDQCKSRYNNVKAKLAITDIKQALKLNLI